MGKAKVFPSLTKVQLIKLYESDQITDIPYSYEPMDKDDGFESVIIVKFIREKGNQWVFGYYGYGCMKDYFLAIVRQRHRGGDLYITFIDGSVLKLKDFKQIGGDQYAISATQG